VYAAESRTKFHIKISARSIRGLVLYEPRIGFSKQPVSDEGPPVTEENLQFSVLADQKLGFPSTCGTVKCLQVCTLLSESRSRTMKWSERLERVCCIRHGSLPSQQWQEKIKVRIRKDYSNLFAKVGTIFHRQVAVAQPV
jgi:hypothetical protein